MNLNSISGNCITQHDSESIRIIAWDTWENHDMNIHIKCIGVHYSVAMYNMACMNRALASFVGMNLSRIIYFVREGMFFHKYSMLHCLVLWLSTYTSNTYIYSKPNPCTYICVLTNSTILSVMYFLQVKRWCKQC